MKIITIIGARPQFIKAAMLSRALATHDGVEEIIIHTGQHFEANMSAVFFNELNIPAPKYNLDIHSLDHGAMTGQMMIKLEPVLCLENPDLVIVYGDTNSTLAGALTAKKLHIPVAHIEAGLRSFNSLMPEEINRIIVDRIADFLFCPTQKAQANLESEGFTNFPCKIYNYGDVMKDAALYFGKSGLEQSIVKKEAGLQNFVLATMHRASTIDNIENLTALIHTLNEINKITSVIVPLHPRTLQAIKQANLQCRFKCIAPLGYLDMLALLQQADVVITDSGGLQKEAYFFEKYCITTRNETEWTELVDAGFNILAGLNNEKIIKAFNEFRLKKKLKHNSFYGDGNAAGLIASTLVKNFS